MRRYLTISIIALMTLLTVITGSAYTFRNFLLETFLSTQLHQQNLPLQSIETLDITPNGLAIDRLVAGKNEELHIHRARITWNWHVIFSGTAEFIRINELTADFVFEDKSSQWTSSPDTLPSLDLRNFIWLPNISLKNIIIRLHSASGNTTLALSGGITPHSENYRAIDLRATLSGTLLQGNLNIAATTDNLGNMQGNIIITSSMLKTPELQIANFFGSTAFKMTALQLQHVETALTFSGINVQTKVIGKSVSSLSIDGIKLIGNISSLPDHRTGKVDIQIENGQWSSEAFKIEQVAISLPIQLDRSGIKWFIGLRDATRMTIGKIAFSDQLFIHAPTHLSITQIQIEAVKEINGWSFQHDIALNTDGLTAQIPDFHSETGKTGIHFYPGSITASGKITANQYYRTKITALDTALHFPSLHLHTKAIGISLHANDPEHGAAADFFIEHLTHQSQNPLFAALSLSGNLSHNSTNETWPSYTLKLSGGIANTNYLALIAHHHPENGTGKLLVELAFPAFSATGLQPSTLFPILHPLRNVDGQIHINAQLNWSKAGIKNSEATLALRNLSFLYDSIDVSDLNMTLYLDNLLSPNSPPHQTITSRCINLDTIPIENLYIDYQIISNADLGIHMTETRFSFMDGTVSFAPSLIYPRSHSNLLIHVNHFDLESFFRLIQVDGLSGSGHLDGEIPLMLSKNGIAITNGLLSANSPGVLHIKSDKAAHFLSSDNQEIQLLLKTLQDFHYRELKLALDKSAEHDLSIKLSLLGSNPLINDQRAFRLNIKLETDLDEIMHAVKKNHRFTDAILDGSFRLH